MNEINNENESLYERQTRQTRNNKCDEIEYDNSNEIKIGYKDTYAYVTFAIGHLLNENNEVILRARGMLIPKGISVAMIVKNNYVKDVSIETEIDSVLLENNFVPTIKIKISKPN